MTKTTLINLVAIDAIKHSLKNGGKDTAEFISTVKDKFLISEEIESYGEPEDFAEAEELAILQNDERILEKRTQIFAFSFGFEDITSTELYNLFKENEIIA